MPPDTAHAAGPPPYVAHGRAGAGPLVVAVPHAGRHYPAAIEAARAVPMALLERIEDRHADRLIADLLARGATGIVATHARAWIDLNRGEDDIASARARGGLGLVPARVGGRDLWRAAPDAGEVARRVALVHRPYHAELARLLAAARAGHGRALLIDCHSMPPLTRGPGAARIVIGDRHGASAGAGVARAAADAAAAAGLPVALNAPYAGAHTLARHGRPDAHVHALQVEVDRALYLDARLLEPVAEGVARVSALLGAIAAAALAALPEAGPLPIAAE